MMASEIEISVDEKVKFSGVNKSEFTPSNGKIENSYKRNYRIDKS